MSDRPDLAREFWDASRIALVPRYHRRLAQLGFNHVARRCCGAVGVARVQWRDGFRGESAIYEPDPHGNVTAVILPVLGAGIEDLTAWDVKANRLASRTGATFALGESWLSGDCESVKVFSDPGAWWRACTAPPVAMMPDPQDDADQTTGQWAFTPLDRFYWHPPGLVVVDWNDARHRLGHVKRIVADSLALAEKIEAATKPQPTPRPQIFIDMQEAIAA